MNNIKAQIDYINKILDRELSNNVSVCTGKLTPRQRKELEKHFIVKPELFGYTMFTRKP